MLLRAGIVCGIIVFAGAAGGCALSGQEQGDEGKERYVRKNMLLRAGIVCGIIVFAGAAGGCALSGQEQGDEGKERYRAEENTAVRELQSLLLPEQNGFLPSYWYAGDYGKKPAVRRQYSQSNCWAVAAASAIESGTKRIPSVLLVCRRLRKEACGAPPVQSEQLLGSSCCLCD